MDLKAALQLPLEQVSRHAAVCLPVLAHAIFEGPEPERSAAAELLLRAPPLESFYHRFHFQVRSPLAPLDRFDALLDSPDMSLKVVAVALLSWLERPSNHRHMDQRAILYQGLLHERALLRGASAALLYRSFDFKRDAPATLPLLGSERAEVREAALMALPFEATGYLKPEEKAVLSAAFQERLSDASKPVQYAAAKKLTPFEPYRPGTAGPEASRVWELTVDELLSSPDEDARSDAADRLIVRWEPAKAIGPLARAVNERLIREWPRAQVTEALARFVSQDAELRQIFVELLRDSSVWVALAAARSLFGTPGQMEIVTGWVLEVLRSPESSAELRQGAVRLFENPYGKQSFPAEVLEVLFVALRDPSREVIQEAVTGLLHYQGPEEGLDSRLLASLESPELPELGRMGAALVLGKRGHRQAIPHLIRVLERADDAFAERHLKIGSGCFGGVHEPGPEMKCTAADILGEFGPLAIEAVPILLKNLGETSSYPLQLATSRALVDLGATEEMLPILGRFKIRGEAGSTTHIYSLGNGSGRVALPRLLEALEDSRLLVRQRALESLLQKHFDSDEERVDALITVLKNSASEVVQGAAEALTRYEDQWHPPRLVPRLLEVWADPTLSEQTRFALTIVLGSRLERVALPQLIRLLGHEGPHLPWGDHASPPWGANNEYVWLKGPDIRCAAAAILGAFGPLAFEGVPALIKTLLSGQPPLIHASVKALQQILLKRDLKLAVEPILERVETEEARQTLRSALEREPDRETHWWVQEALGDPREPVRHKAIDFLFRYESISETNLKLLMKTLSDASSDLVQDAAILMTTRKIDPKFFDTAGLVEILKAPTTPEMGRFGAALVLGSRGAPIVIPSLVRLIEQDEAHLLPVTIRLPKAFQSRIVEGPAIKCLAVEVLSKFGRAAMEHVPTLVAHLSSGSLPVQVYVIAALFRLGGSDLLGPPLDALLKATPDEALRASLKAYVQDLLRPQ
ncbi:HEAT repeat domain-containing protein [Hyalangium versicolor]|uniref:HEAT repeat domain-containing protein n=1 Tax=Hyalangium versicolor TaxID=2861190 RepID=UPI001CCD5CDE|nr:HEAT repeat domain-containing protein [Hyalangium versicolor]